MYGTARASSTAPRSTSWRGTEWVRSMTRASSAILAMMPWQMPTNESLRRSRSGRRSAGSSAPRPGVGRRDREIALEPADHLGARDPCLVAREDVRPVIAGREDQRTLRLQALRVEGVHGL